MQFQYLHTQLVVVCAIFFLIEFYLIAVVSSDLITLIKGSNMLQKYAKKAFSQISLNAVATI